MPDDFERNTLRDQHVHAARLVELCRLVPWGSGDPIERAVMCILEAAEAYDLPTETYQSMVRSQLSAAKKDAILARDGYMCVRCSSARWVCVDHIVPVYHGGTNTPENLQTLCRDCNRAKSNK